jgi:cell division septation protein DedD
VSPAARGQSGGGAGGLRVGVIALALVLGVAFVFGAGMLVGRHWEGAAARDASPKDPAANGAGKKAASRRAASEPEVERLRDAGDKLTFYHTLTAPLGPAPSYPKPAADGKARSAAGTSTAAAPPPGAGTATTSRDAAPAGSASTAPAPSRPANPASSAPATAAAPAAGPWSVQVGAFDSRQQADALQQDLRRAGFEAYLTTLGAAEGKTRFRVRVGTFPDRALAQRAADRLRAERSLPTFVTAN